MTEIKNFIYLDMEKVSSLYSQIVGGIVQSTEVSTSTTKDNKNLRNYDFKVFKHEAGGTEEKSQNLTEARVSHHEIYNELELELFNNHCIADIGTDVVSSDVKNGNATSIFEKALCVKVEGYVVFEDYQRIARIAENHGNIVEIINKSSDATIDETPEIRGLMDQVIEFKKEISAMKNGPLKTKKRAEISQIEETLDSLRQASHIDKVPEWIIDGIKTWIRVFLPNIFNIRVYPFEDLENFHVMANLKRQFFMDDDTESLHYSFGSKPTVKMTMLGIVASVPSKEGSTFDPMSEFSDSTDTTENDSVMLEDGFRSLFRGFDGLEEMIRTCRYPRIMVQPLAIYRSVKTSS